MTSSELVKELAFGATFGLAAGFAAKKLDTSLVAGKKKRRGGKGKRKLIVLSQVR